MYSRRDVVAIILTAMIAICFWSCAQAALPTGYYGRASLTTPTVTGTHTDTPVLFKAATGNFPQMASDGSDIRVYSAAGNMMPHEIADLGTDSVTIWFEADTLATGQTFYVYSGHDSPPAALATTATWDSAAAAYHYAGTPSQGATLSDAAGNVDAVAGGNWESAHRGTGQVGTGWKNDNLRGVSVPDLNVTGDWTISTWLRPVGNTTDVIAQGNPWWWFVAAQASNANPQPSFVARYGDWNVSYAYSGCANDGTWAHYAVTFTTTPDTALTIYRNGVECTNTYIFQIGTPNEISSWYELGYDIDLQGQNFNGGSAPFGLASQSYATGGNQQDQYNGWVDEYAIYTTAFSADKVAAVYGNQADPVGWFTTDFQFGLTSEPSSVPPPSIIAISDRLKTNYGRVTITGTDFGPRVCVTPDPGIGPNGFIERAHPTYTGPHLQLGNRDYGYVPLASSEWGRAFTSAETPWSPTANPPQYGSGARISEALVLTGNKSMDVSLGVNDSIPRLGFPSSASSRQIGYNQPGEWNSSNPPVAPQQQHDEFYFSWWTNWEVLYYNLHMSKFKSRRGSEKRCPPEDYPGDPAGLDSCRQYYTELDSNAQGSENNAMATKPFWVSSENQHVEAGSISFVGKIGSPASDKVFAKLSWQASGADKSYCLPDSTGCGTDSYFKSAIEHSLLDGESIPQMSDYRELGNFPVLAGPAQSPSQGVWFRTEIRGKINSLTTDGLLNGVPDGEIDVWFTSPDDGMARTLVSKGRNMIFREADGTRTNAVTFDPGINPEDAWRQASIQSYFWDTENAIADIFIDDVYLQMGSQARVELGNASTLDACTKLFAQEIVSWSDESIVINLNHGNFSEGDPAWLFVINNRGEVSSKAMPRARPVGGRDVDDLIGGE